jgi:S-phase kinase-associated protein 1
MEVDSPSDPAVHLKSSDGTLFQTTLKSIKMSGTIKDMLDHIDDGIENIGVIPLQNVDSTTLVQVIKWIEHHKNTPQPTSEEIKDKTADTIDEWDENYLQELDLDNLYDLVRRYNHLHSHALTYFTITQITAANYLNIPQLLWLTTRKIAMMIKNKSPQEIRTLFNIENDWTAQELENVQKENQWCEEK